MSRSSQRWHGSGFRFSRIAFVLEPAQSLRTFLFGFPFWYKDCPNSSRLVNVNLFGNLAYFSQWLARFHPLLYLISPSACLVISSDYFQTPPYWTYRSKSTSACSSSKMGLKRTPFHMIGETVPDQQLKRKVKLNAEYRLIYRSLQNLAFGHHQECGPNKQ
jgi:hypothetical protein